MDMKNTLSAVRRHRYFLWFIFLFAYVQSVQVRYTTSHEINALTFTPEAAVIQLGNACILFFIMRYLSAKWPTSNVPDFKHLLRVFVLSIGLYFATMQVLGLLIAGLFGTFERNFNANTLMYTSFGYFLNALIYGSFYLSYAYYRRNKQHQEQLKNYDRALAESKIMQLKNQMNPHFLFNNLNVLDQLIEEDKTLASDFLNNFAELYRYVLQVSDQKLIALSQEITFARQYFNLIRYKFGNAYQLEFEIKKTEAYIVPMTLQLLIENAIKHNLGSAEQPVVISVKIDHNVLVSNTLQPKPNPAFTSGKALNNLSDQYHLLSRQPIVIHRDASVFAVEIPLIHALNDD
jgi:hypothetical protein